jgi:hypothetical protein
VTMDRRCSFCSRKKGDGLTDAAVHAIENHSLAVSEEKRAEIVARLRSLSDRKVRLVLPGRGELAICDICIDLYNESAKRELALPT